MGRRHPITPALMQSFGRGCGSWALDRSGVTDRFDCSGTLIGAGIDRLPSGLRIGNLFRMGDLVDR